MTQDELIEMARVSGFLSHGDLFYTNHRYGDCKLELEAFAKLVAAKEREACAEICEEAHELMNSSFQGAAEAIRARGKA